MKEKKICNRCSIEKEICEFYKSNRTKDGYGYTCKDCRGLEGKEYYSKNTEKLKEKSQKWRKNNSNKVKESLNKYRIENLDKVRELKQKWSKSENGKNSKKQYYTKNSEKVKKRVIEYNKKNPEVRIKYTNSDKNKNYMRLFKKKHYEQNPHVYALRTILRNTLKRIGMKKQGKTVELLGYSALELKEHIEKLFLEGMSWENHGEWHIDHKKPVSSFDKSEKISIINSLDNLQPLWAQDNLKKSNKF